MGAPISLLLDGVSSEHFTILLVLYSVLNAAIWGCCLGLPIYALTKRFRHVAAS